MRYYWLVFLVCLGWLVSYCDSSFGIQEPSAPPPQPAAPSDDTPSNPLTAAEKIAELQSIIESDTKQLQDLETELDDPNSEYAVSEREFRALDAELEKIQEQLQEAQRLAEADRAERLSHELASVERQRKLAQDRFDLAIESRKTLREQIQTLRSKLTKDRDALDNLTGEKEETDNPNTSTDRQGTDETPDRTSNDPQDTASSANEPAPRDDSESGMGDEQEEVDEELKEVEAEAEAKEQEAREAVEETKSLEARIKDIQRLVAQEQKEQALAKRKLDLAAAAQQAFQEELSRRTSEQAPAEEIKELRDSLNEASQRMLTARSEVNEIGERLNEHRSELSMLQSEHIMALHEAKLKAQEAAEAEARVESLRNPFAPRNLMQWALDHGPRLLAIVLGMFVLNRIVWFFSTRSIQLVSSGTGRGSKVERENRAKTLVGVFQNAASVAIFVTGTLMFLEEVGANITVLMGGVAVIGLAVAFGAQNLIKDYFYGFVMLLENQYMLNDSIRIGSVSGQVERITLRMTVLRDANGIVHFIPNGTINSVSNETHGWSRAVCEVLVGYDEDVERVQALIRQVNTELAEDEKFGALMLENPSDPAIEAMGESNITLRTVVKTLPSKQGAVKQEWLRRVQSSFRRHRVTPPNLKRHAA